MPRILAGVTALALLGTVACGVQTSDRMTTTDDEAPASVGAIGQGSFRRAEAAVSGSFEIRTEGGNRVLMLSTDFKTSDSAPDLKVAFSPSATPLASSTPPNYPLEPGTYTVLAPLKASSGAQSYAIPASIDLDEQGSVLIWCEQFNATMAWAPLRS